MKLYVTMLSDLKVPVFMNMQLSSADELVKLLQDDPPKGGTLLVEIRHAVNSSSFFNFNCTNFSLQNFTTALNKATLLQSITEAELIEMFDAYRPTRTVTSLPPKLRSAMLNWLGHNTSAYKASTSCKLGSYLVYIDQTHPEPQFRAILLSSLLGSAPYAMHLANHEEPKRQKTQLTE